MGRPTLSATLTVLFLAAVAARAEVKIRVLDDGTKVIYNETSDQRARRQSSRLVAVPSIEVGALIERYASRNGLDPQLIQAVMQVESGYNPRALSSKGAMGLMQLMPATARELQVTDPYDAEQNVRGGTLYLRRLLRRFSGDLPLALAAYNAGPTAVSRYGGIPPYRETERYVRKVLGLYHGDGPSQLLQEHARSEARRLAREAATKTGGERGGAPVFVTRDKDGNLVMTTSPKSN